MTTTSAQRAGKSMALASPTKKREVSRPRFSASAALNGHEQLDRILERMASSDERATRPIALHAQHWADDSNGLRRSAG